MGDIGDAIRVVREARGISQEELAQANTYDRFYLNKLEMGGSTVYITSFPGWTLLLPETSSVSRCRHFGSRRVDPKFRPVKRVRVSKIRV